MSNSDSDSKIIKRNTSNLDRIKQAKVAKALSKKQPKSISKETLLKAVSQSAFPKLLFSLDATASREHAWNTATEISMAMFDNIPGTLEVALAYHGGSSLKKFTKYSSSKEQFRREILSLKCEAGMTRLCSILEKALETNRLKAIIYIGDYYEELEEEANDLASRLALKGTRVFIFQDTPSNSFTSKTFESIATITKGAVLPFDQDSPEILKEILEAIAHYATAGFAAVKKLESKGAKLLLRALTYSRH